MMVVAVVPALDEAETVAAVVRTLRTLLPVPVAAVVVVDGGSRDRTVAEAQTAGAVVCVETRPGYGRACRAGVEAARQLGADAVVFVDATGAIGPSEVAAVMAPIARGEADLVLGARQPSEPGAMRGIQRAGNRLATALISLRFGRRFADLGSLRAIRLDALDRLRMTEPAHGWPAEMQVKAIRCGLRVKEVPIRYGKRKGGRSKVSGSLRGAVLAGCAILRVVLWGTR
jgi:glycosyltransferase involved in cell wall biosynthesis